MENILIYQTEYYIKYEVFGKKISRIEWKKSLVWQIPFMIINSFIFFKNYFFWPHQSMAKTSYYGKNSCLTDDFPYNEYYLYNKYLL